MQPNIFGFPFIPIPLPTEIPRERGILATSGPDGIFISCRGLVAERRLIQQAAARIGVTYGEFIRRVTTDAATYIIEHIPEQK